MTTERIDHVGEARACEEAGLSVMREMGKDLAPHMEAVMQFDLARLHAQLALVEQQRIANLLAIARETHADLISGLEAMGLDENDFEVPLGLNNLKKASF